MAAALDGLRVGALPASPCPDALDGFRVKSSSVVARPLRESKEPAGVPAGRLAGSMAAALDGLAVGVSPALRATLPCLALGCFEVGDVWQGTLVHSGRGLAG